EVPQAPEGTLSAPPLHLRHDGEGVGGGVGPPSPAHWGRGPGGEGAPAAGTSDLDAAFERAGELGRPKRASQVELARLAAETLRGDGYAVIEAPTGTGKSMGYLLPAALF